jgi:hypothetical protein
MNCIFSSQIIPHGEDFAPILFQQQGKSAGELSSSRNELHPALDMQAKTCLCIGK